MFATDTFQIAVENMRNLHKELIEMEFQLVEVSVGLKDPMVHKNIVHCLIRSPSMQQNEESGLGIGKHRQTACSEQRATRRSAAI